MRSVGMRLLALAIAQPLLGGRCIQGFITNNPLSIHHRSDAAINRACTIDMSTLSAKRRVMRVAMSDSNSNGDEDRVEDGEAVVSSSSDTMPSVSTPSAPMGPTLQPEEDKLREKAMEPKENKWASGAFKRGVALQAVVLALVIYLQLQPQEVGRLAVCAPFTHGPGCVSFGKWIEIVFFGAPIPIY